VIRNWWKKFFVLITEIYFESRIALIISDYSGIGYASVIVILLRARISIITRFLHFIPPSGDGTFFQTIKIGKLKGVNFVI